MKYEVTRSGFGLLFAKFGLLRFDHIDQTMVEKIKAEWPELTVSSSGLWLRGIRLATVLE